MLKIQDRAVSIMVLYATLLHITWGLMILGDDSALRGNALDSIFKIFPYPDGVALLLFGAAMMALVGTVAHTKGFWVALLLIPQQILMMITAAGAIESIWLGQFADGVIRSHMFIASGEVNNIIAALCHTTALVLYARGEGERA